MNQPTTQASTAQRALAALCALAALVLDDQHELQQARIELARLNAAELMSELASWRYDAQVMPEYRPILRQHGFAA